MDLSRFVPSQNFTDAGMGTNPDYAVEMWHEHPLSAWSLAHRGRAAGAPFKSDVTMGSALDSGIALANSALSDSAPVVAPPSALRRALLDLYHGGYLNFGTR